MHINEKVQILMHINENVHNQTQYIPNESETLTVDSRFGLWVIIHTKCMHEYTSIFSRPVVALKGSFEGHSEVKGHLKVHVQLFKVDPCRQNPLFPHQFP